MILILLQILLNAIDEMLWGHENNRREGALAVCGKYSFVIKV